MIQTFACAALILCPATSLANPATAYVRVNQAGYELGSTTARAYLMSTVPESGATFKVVNAEDATAFKGKIGELLGTWANSPQLSYYVYALDFKVPAGHSYSISVSGPANAHSPRFAVDNPDVLYPGLLLNTLFFYESQRDGPDFIPNALRDAPGHLKDKSATAYAPPPLDDNDFIDYTPPAGPLSQLKAPKLDVSGGWWDAGDYEKYIETTSYTVALMEIGIRDFPAQMGPQAPLHPPAPPNSVSYAGDSGPGAPRSTDFSTEAKVGVQWLLKMVNNRANLLAYQVDNTDDWDYYGEGNPTSASGNCGGDYNTPYCLISEYDIWTLPQAADNFFQDGDPEPCDPLTTYYICNRPVFAVPNPTTIPTISPNLAGRLTASFALCYQIYRTSDQSLAQQCLTAAEQTYNRANTQLPDPAGYGDTTACSNCLLTITPFDGYPETVWEDDMELGATELFRAEYRAESVDDRPSRSPHPDLEHHLSQAAQFAAGYIANIADPGYSDTLNLYDVSGLAHFDLYRALMLNGDKSASDSFAVTPVQLRLAILKQVNNAIEQSATDPFGFGIPWLDGDTTSHGAGLSVMASEAYHLTRESRFNTYSQRWLGNILGANSWGASFIVGDGSTFPNCIQHQLANLAGALNGTSGGIPILWGAATEGPDSYTTSGLLDNMNLCPANGVDPYANFNGNSGTYNPGNTAYFLDDVQSYNTTEPAIDLTATSFLMWSWRLAGHPADPVQP